MGSRARTLQRLDLSDIFVADAVLFTAALIDRTPIFEQLVKRQLWTTHRHTLWLLRASTRLFMSTSLVMRS